MMRLTRLALVVPAFCTYAVLAMAQEAAPDASAVPPGPPPDQAAPALPSGIDTDIPPQAIAPPPIPAPAAYPAVTYPQPAYVAPYSPPAGYGYGYGYSYGNPYPYAAPGWLVGQAPPPPQIARMYCDNPAGYYPYVFTCYGRWIHYH